MKRVSPEANLQAGSVIEGYNIENGSNILSMGRWNPSEESNSCLVITEVLPSPQPPSPFFFFPVLSPSPPHLIPHLLVSHLFLFSIFMAPSLQATGAGFLLLLLLLPYAVHV